MANQNELKGIKSIRNSQRKDIGEKIREQLSLGWIFEKWYEKIILIILCLLGLWKLIEFF